MNRPRVVVVGGGLVGLLAAWEAVERGCDVRVLERARFGGAATGWSLGLCPPLGWGERGRTLAARSRVFYAPLTGASDGAVREVPLLIVADGHQVAGLRERSIGSGLVDEGTAVARLASSWPDVRVAPDERLLHTAEPALLVDPARMVALLLGRLRAAGARCWAGCDVRDVRAGGDEWLVDLRGGGVVTADVVILAPGARLALGRWGRETSADLRCKRIVALHAAADTVPTSCILFPRDELFLLPDAEASLVLVSFFREAFAGAEEDLDTDVDDNDLHAGRRALAARAPFLAKAVVGGRASHDAYTQTRSPLVELLRPGLVVAGGCSGSGVNVAPALAEEAVTLALGGNGPERAEGNRHNVSREPR